MKRAIVILLGLVPAVAFAGGEDFEYDPAGALLPGSGQGAMDDTVYSPGMRFPMEEGPAFANSQVYMNGGGQGPGGGQCDAVNYSYPWRDNYCEIRSWDMPLCPAGTGHQGQDIRPATCDDSVHWNVSTVDGTVTNIGSYSVYVTAPDGSRYDWLHGAGNVVGSGQSIARGERINKVSNAFNGTPTTIHMHFNIKQDVAGVGNVYVSPYMSLVTSYQELLGITGTGVGALESTDCEAIDGWAWDPGAPDDAVTVQLSFDGPLGGGSPVLQIVADQNRPDLCDELESCDHGFSVLVPLGIRDGAPHEVHAYAIDGGRSQVELETSPLVVQCDAPPVPDGVRRPVSGPEVAAAWNISPFYDVATIDDATVAAIPEDREFPAEPVLVVSDADPDTMWLMDPGYRRRVSSVEIAEAWGLSPDDAQTWPASVVEDVPLGSPLRPERFLLRDSTGAVWAMDDEQCPLTDDGQLDPDCADSADDGGADGTGGGDDDDDDDGGGGNGGNDDGGTETDGAALPGAGDGDSGGCGCRSSDAPGWAVLLLLLPALRRRRYSSL